MNQLKDNWLFFLDLINNYYYQRGGTFIPDFSGGTLLASLDGYLDSPEENKETIEQIKKKFFSRFFVTKERLSSLAYSLDVSRHPWRMQIKKELEELCNKSPTIRLSDAPLLSKKFDWSVVSKNRKEDTLYRAKLQRMEFLPRVALGVIYGDIDPAKLCTLLDKWKVFAKKGKSRIPYYSTLVVIQRILAISWAFAYVAASNRKDTINLEIAMLQILGADIGFLLPRLGNSYRNNHVLTDWFGGWYISTVFPDFVPKKFSECDFEAKWVNELLLQTLEDGSGFEQSVHYHEFGCEMASAYFFLKKRRKESLEKKIESRIGKMLRFQSDLAGKDSLTPAIGNATEDPLFPLCANPGSKGTAWRELYRTLFDSCVSPSDSQTPPVEYAYWMAGGNLAPVVKCTTSDKILMSYPDGGYFIIQDLVKETRTLFRTGPARSEDVIGGHAHSDLLSVQQSYKGVPILVDPGTYTYRYGNIKTAQGEANWRKYFAGPSSHNGLIIDEIDPVGELKNDFRKRSFEISVKTESKSDRDFGCWIHAITKKSSPLSGYSRTVVQINDEYTLITDDLPQAFEKNNTCYGFQFAQKMSVKKMGGRTVKLSLGKEEWILKGDEKLDDLQIMEGSLDPMGGWISQTYGELVPAPQIRYKMPSYGLSAFIIRVGTMDKKIIRIGTERIANESCVIHIEWEDENDVLIVNNEKIIKSISWSDIDFRGRLLWHRQSNGDLKEVRGLDVIDCNIREQVKFISCKGGPESFCIKGHKSESA